MGTASPRCERFWGMCGSWVMLFCSLTRRTPFSLPVECTAAPLTTPTTRWRAVSLSLCWRPDVDVTHTCLCLLVFGVPSYCWQLLSQLLTFIEGVGGASSSTTVRGPRPRPEAAAVAARRCWSCFMLFSLPSPDIPSFMCRPRGHRSFSQRTGRRILIWPCCPGAPLYFPLSCPITRPALRFGVCSPSS